jgi:hypothetical protein
MADAVCTTDIQVLSMLHTLILIIHVSMLLVLHCYFMKLHLHFAALQDPRYYNIVVRMDRSQDGKNISLVVSESVSQQMSEGMSEWCAALTNGMNE